MSLTALRCIVVDDEPPSIKLLDGYIKNTPVLQCLKTFTNPLEALAWLAQNDADLIFLDISMPELNGLDFAKTIKGKAKVILCTAYREYGAESYEYGVSDYLVKPVTYTRFLASVQKIIDESKLKPTATQPVNNFIMVTGEGRFNHIKINFEDILFVAANKNNVVFQCEKELKHALMTMKEAEAMLPANRFLRVHVSYIVCIDRISRLDNSTIVLKNCKEAIPIGPAYRDALMAALKI